MSPRLWFPLSNVAHESCKRCLKYHVCLEISSLSEAAFTRSLFELLHGAFAVKISMAARLVLHFTKFTQQSGNMPLSLSPLAYHPHASIVGSDPKRSKVNTAEPSLKVWMPHGRFHNRFRGLPTFMVWSLPVQKPAVSAESFRFPKLSASFHESRAHQLHKYIERRTGT